MKKIVKLFILLILLIIIVLTKNLKKPIEFKIVSFNEGLNKQYNLVLSNKNIEYKVLIYDSNNLLIEQQNTTESIVYLNKITDDKIFKIIVIGKNNKEEKQISFNYKRESHIPRIYLSPSTQCENLGNEKTNYTTECEMMNKIVDVTEAELKNTNLRIYRNNITMTLDEVVRESKELDVDLHLAFHSNSHHKNNNIKGVETWIYSEEEKIYPLAISIQKNLMSIYPKKSGNRGVKTTINDEVKIREVNPINIDNGILMEIGFHDNYDDAKWISNNVEIIGKTIAKTIEEYFLK